jgi:hypothetical protein
MKKLSIIAAFGAVAMASPAVAHHVDHLNDPFDSRGACEAETQALSNTDDFLLDVFPDLFATEGELRSFLNRAFTCELRGDSWYITDHRAEVLGSDWFLRRKH